MLKLIEVKNFTKKFTEDELTGVIKIKRNFFQVSPELENIKESVAREAFSAGMFLGSGKPFHPSTSLLNWLGERTDRYVVVDKKAAWLFLCGRDVFKKSIKEQLVHDGLVLVKNELGEVLGYGEVKNQKIAIKNVLDKGDFIRREKR